MTILRNTRDDVVRAAGRLFADRGYHGTSMRDLGRELGLHGSSLYSHISSKEDLLVDLASRAAAEDGADVVLLAGAPLAGLAGRVRDRVPVPVIDCVGAAVLQAQALVALAPRKAVIGTYRRPDPKISIGLAPALAKWLAHR